MSQSTPTKHDEGTVLFAELLVFNGHHKSLSETGESCLESMFLVLLYLHFWTNK